MGWEIERPGWEWRSSFFFHMVGVIIFLLSLEAAADVSLNASLNANISTQPVLVNQYPIPRVLLYNAAALSCKT